MGNIKHTSTGEVHYLKTDTRTGCGVDLSYDPSAWEKTKSRITCGRNGCKGD